MCVFFFVFVFFFFFMRPFEKWSYHVMPLGVRPSVNFSYSLRPT